jgi:pyrroline-5-carboxylate reductase
MSDEPRTLVIVGGGNMGTALLEGILGGGAVPRGDLAVVEVLDERRDALSTMLPGIEVVATIPPCRAAVIAVKPADAPDAARGAVAAGATRVLSIAAGVTLDRLAEACGPKIAVVRAMPNTPAIVGLGVTAISGTDAAALDWAETLLSAVGDVERLPESMIDGFTAVAGSGPAYVFLVAEALAAAAVREGFAPDVAERIVAQLLLGSATLLHRRGDPVALRAQVTSPGGTTAAGIAALESAGARAAFDRAVVAAAERSREMSRG